MVRMLLGTGCPGEVCAECFVQFKCDKFERKAAIRGKRPPCPLGCRKKQMQKATANGWWVKQPQLVLQTDDARKLADEMRKSRAAQIEQAQPWADLRRPVCSSAGG